jgi:hypothetical protein
VRQAQLAASHRNSKDAGQGAVYCEPVSGDVHVGGQPVEPSTGGDNKKIQDQPHALPAKKSERRNLLAGFVGWFSGREVLVILRLARILLIFSNLKTPLSCGT